MRRLLCKRVPVWLSATIITVMLAVVVYPWTGVYDYQIEIMSISTSDSIYLPHTLTGVAWNDDIPLHSLRVQYTLYNGDYGSWVDLETVRLEGWDIRQESAITSREALNAGFMTAGLSYAVRIYLIDYDSNVFPNPEDMSSFEAEDAVVTFEIKEGVSPR